MTKRVLLTGGTGFIGSALLTRLHQRGNEMIVVTRNKNRARGQLPSGCIVVEGDPTRDGPWQEMVAGCDVVINLAGANVAAHRWTRRYRAEIVASRVDTTRSVVKAISAAPRTERPAVLLSASAVDYYPFSDELEAGPDTPVTEETRRGSGFLANLCDKWERTALEARQAGVRVSTLRKGIVLGAHGALPKMITPFRLFVGGPLGTGDQWFSWIHIDDVVSVYLQAMVDPEITGPINLVAPGTIRNGGFARALGSAIGRRSWLPMPALAVRAAAGEIAVYLVNGRRVVPNRLAALGYSFHYPRIREAITDAVSQLRKAA